MMSPLLPFMGVILLFWFVVGHGGVFLTASAFCGNLSFYCSNGDSFGYPFMPGEGNFGSSGDGPISNEQCGYPTLSIDCNAYGRPVINISNNTYYILSNSPDSQSLRVVGVDVDEEECPRPMHNFTLPTTSPFSDPYDTVGYNITYFYNCSSSSGYPKEVVQGLPCLDTYYNNNNYNNNNNNNKTTLTGLRSFAFPDFADGYNITYFYNCSSSSGYPKEVVQVQGLPCLDTYYNNNNTPGLRSFAFSDFADGRFNRSADERFNWFPKNCQESVVVPVQNVYDSSDLKKSLKLGFDLFWSTPAECKHGSERRMFDKACPIQTTSQGPTTNTSQSNFRTGATTNTSQSNGHIGISTQLKIILGVCSGVGGLFLVILFIFRRKLSSLHSSIASHWKSKFKSQTNVEAFLESCGCPGLQRYRYSEIKRMTNAFKEKLGQGGFGSVYKGKLPDGRLVAVKVLNESKGNGEDFINEVATIGGTNHVNVVSLLGFCSNGNKRALVYEFMPNGSLEKFIYNRENTSITNPPLGSEKLYQIALGIARGLEYLHRGCKIRILHFDIKPHNILLDQDFCPKIADFGLAKLCQTRESIVSMHVARGTMGYIAPEVTCINFGGVSHKSDVYSYGMMILEMIGGRKNIDTTVENISEIYFPQWMYNHYIHGIDDLDGHNEIFKEETIRKMIVVALHSIQTQPADRPSISKVVEMLEGNVDELQMPPNPFQDPPRFSP